jgi:hypothetical protein
VIAIAGVLFEMPAISATRLVHISVLDDMDIPVAGRIEIYQSTGKKDVINAPIRGTANAFITCKTEIKIIFFPHSGVHYRTELFFCHGGYDNDLKIIVRSKQIN